MEQSLSGTRDESRRASAWRPRLAIMLLCLFALANIRIVPAALKRMGKPEPDQAGPFLAKMMPLAARLPAEHVFGFALDDEHTDLAYYSFGARLFLTQYAFSPRLIEHSTAHRFVIVDSDAPEVVPRMAIEGHWSLVADLGNGVRLYRTNKE
jgi:hypothetical protein